MIIKSIQLKNFMSYKDAYLDLTGIKVACIVGLNGAGKSSILDGITFALWDKSRSSSEDLIRQGENEMSVTFTFEHLNNSYRVSRGKFRGKSRNSTKSFLNFSILTNDEWLSLEGSTLKDTQSQIDNVIKLQYETFINSVYLRQGKADEFTVKTASQRKEILGEILNLSYFEELQEKVKVKSKECEDEIKSLENQLQNNTEIDLTINNLNNDLSQINLNLNKIETKLSETETKKNELIETNAKIEQNKNKIKELQKQEIFWQEDIKELKKELQEINSNIDQLFNLSQNKDEITAKYNDYNQKKSQLDVQEKIKYEILELNNTITELNSIINLEKSNIENKINNDRDIIEKNSIKIKKLDEYLSNESKILDDFNNYNQLKEKYNQAKITQKKHNDLIESKIKIENIIKIQENKLENEFEYKKNTLKEIKDKTANFSSLKSEEENTAKELKLINEFEKELISLKENGELLKKQIEEFENNKKNNLNEITNIRTKLNTLNNNNLNDKCPLCLSTIEDKSRVIEHYHNEIQNLENQITQSEIFVNKSNIELNNLRNKYSDLNSKCKDKENLIRKHQNLKENILLITELITKEENIEKELLEIKNKIDNKDFNHDIQQEYLKVKESINNLNFSQNEFDHLENEINKLKNIEIEYSKLNDWQNEKKELQEEVIKLSENINQNKNLIENNKYAQIYQQKLQEIEIKKNNLNYNQNYHEELKNKIDELKNFEKQFNELEHIENQLNSLEQRKANINNKIIDKQNKIDSLINEINSISNISDTINFEIELQKCSDEVKNLNQEIKDYTTKKYQLEASLSHYQDLLEKNKNIIHKQNELKNNLAHFKTLYDLLGKNGIQAAIIENSIPEIESEANRLLQKLSNNQMNIEFKTQKETKSGKSSETLEILISDNLGIRPYELFSGGEAFRANFAIRVALSKLLTRRSNAKLETLIIDEGFGSQDDESRERLIRTINSIEDEFACILVISHMSDIKEMFKTHIEVSKNNNESSIKVIN